MARKKKEIRVGVFGIARGSSFLKNFKKIKGVKVVAACETNEETIEKARTKGYLTDDIKLYSDFYEFIDCGLDAVVLANFFHQHVEYAIAALERKIHVLSEPTAAPTLAECVQLCRAVEKSKCKYMLAANTSWMPGPVELRRLYQSGEIGKAIFAEAEYLHPLETEPTGFVNRDKSAYTHWRKHLPRTYYNMHSLGALMEITGSVPVKASGKACFTPEFSEAMSQPYMGDSHGYAIVETDKGAVFMATGCAATGPISKWFRIAGDKGNIETLRFDEKGVRIDYMKYAIPEELGETNHKVYYPSDARSCGLFTPEEIEYAGLSESKSSTHYGNCDFYLTLYFVKYLRGEVEPFFNVYNACALSAAAILSWRSILNGGKEYDIPDFKDKRRRRKYEKDFLSPFPDENGVKTVPTSSKEYDLFKKYNID